MKLHTKSWSMCLYALLLFFWEWEPEVLWDSVRPKVPQGSGPFVKCCVELIFWYTRGRQTGSCSDLTHRYPSLAGLLQGCQSPETMQLPHGQPHRDTMPLEPSFQLMLSVLRCVSLSVLISHPQGPVLEKAWGIWVTFAELEAIMRIFRQRGTEAYAFLSHNLHT